MILTQTASASPVRIGNVEYAEKTGCLSKEIYITADLVAVVVHSHRADVLPNPLYIRLPWLDYPAAPRTFHRLTYDVWHKLQASYCQHVAARKTIHPVGERDATTSGRFLALAVMVAEADVNGVAIYHGSDVAA